MALRSLSSQMREKLVFPQSNAECYIKSSSEKKKGLLEIEKDKGRSPRKDKWFTKHPPEKSCGCLRSAEQRNGAAGDDPQRECAPRGASAPPGNARMRNLFAFRKGKTSRYPPVSELDRMQCFISDAENAG